MILQYKFELTLKINGNFLFLSKNMLNYFFKYTLCQLTSKINTFLNVISFDPQLANSKFAWVR